MASSGPARRTGGGADDDAVADRPAVSRLSDLRHSARDLRHRDRHLLLDPADRAASGHVRIARQLGAAGGSVLYFCRRDHGAGGISAPPGRWTKSLFGSTKASLPITTVATCVVFGAISGSSAATVAAVGRITFKPMLDAGYDRRFATGLLTASGLIDNMIPPSIAMILYAIVAEQSLVRIFTAGFVPGFLFAFAFVAYVLVKSWGSAIDPPEPFRWQRLSARRCNAAWALGMPVIILGGIYSGILSGERSRRRRLRLRHHGGDVRSIAISAWTNCSSSPAAPPMSPRN